MNIIFMRFFRSFRQSLRTDLMVHQSKLTGKRPTLMSAEQRRLLALNKEKPSTDMSDIMFNKIGACFNQLQSPSTSICRMDSRVPVKYVEEIFQLCKRLMDKEVTSSLDKMVDEFGVSVISYPYKSFTEAVNFIVTSLLRELLQSSTGMFLVGNSWTHFGAKNSHVIGG